MKKVVILRGPSGAGKSTIVKNSVLKNHGQVAVCSADKFFERAGKTHLGKPLVIYDFDVAKLPEAHNWCMEQFLHALIDGCDVVVVDNTNIQRWEYRNYELAARLAGYEVEIIEVVPKTVEEIRLCAARNVHRVPAGVVASMLMRFEHDQRAIEFPVLKG